MSPFDQLRSVYFSRDETAGHGIATTSSARVQLGYVLRRCCSNYFHHLLCSRYQLQSKLDEYKYVAFPMRRALCLETCGMTFTPVERIQNGLLSQCSFASAKNQSQTESRLQSDETNNKENPDAGSFCTGVLQIAYILTYWAQLSSEQRLLYWGAKVNHLIRRGQIWRLVTSPLLHANVLHLMMNYYALKDFGPPVEQSYGGPLFFGIYFSSALSGSLLSFFLEPKRSVGASGAIFGLLGASCVYAGRHMDTIDNGAKHLDSIVTTIALNLACGWIFRRYIDNWSHVGGLLGGTAFSWYFGSGSKNTE